MQVAGLPRDGGLLPAAHLSRKSSVTLIASGAPWSVAGEAKITHRPRAEVSADGSDQNGTGDPGD